MKDYSCVDPWSKALGRYPLRIAIERYFIALELVRAYGDSFSNVLLTDSRDVIIQSDPFSLSYLTKIPDREVEGWSTPCIFGYWGA
jgi:hypothetical protein